MQFSSEKPELSGYFSDFNEEYFDKSVSSNGHVRNLTMKNMQLRFFASFPSDDTTTIFGDFKFKASILVTFHHYYFFFHLLWFHLLFGFPVTFLHTKLCKRYFGGISSTAPAGVDATSACMKFVPQQYEYIEVINSHLSTISINQSKRGNSIT